jgi:hypothetical protein
MDAVIGVYDGGDLVVGRYFEKGRRELLAFSDVDGVHAVRKATSSSMIDTS